MEVSILLMPLIFPQHDFYHLHSVPACGLTIVYLAIIYCTHHSLFNYHLLFSLWEGLGYYNRQFNNIPIDKSFMYKLGVIA